MPSLETLEANFSLITHVDPYHVKVLRFCVSQIHRIQLMSAHSSFDRRFVVANYAAMHKNKPTTAASIACSRPFARVRRTHYYRCTKEMTDSSARCSTHAGLAHS